MPLRSPISATDRNRWHSASPNDVQEDTRSAQAQGHSKVAAVRSLLSRTRASRIRGPVRTAVSRGGSALSLLNPIVALGNGSSQHSLRLREGTDEAEPVVAGAAGDPEVGDLLSSRVRPKACPGSSARRRERA